MDLLAVTRMATACKLLFKAVGLWGMLSLTIIETTPEALLPVSWYLLYILNQSASGKFPTFELEELVHTNLAKAPAVPLQNCISHFRGGGKYGNYFYFWFWLLSFW